MRAVLFWSTLCCQGDLKLEIEHPTADSKMLDSGCVLLLLAHVIHDFRYNDMYTDLLISTGAF